MGRARTVVKRLALSTRRSTDNGYVNLKLCRTARLRERRALQEKSLQPFDVALTSLKYCDRYSSGETQPARATTDSL